MKKTLFFLMLFAIVAFTSCSKEDSPSDPGISSKVTLNVAAHTPTTRAVSVTRYIVEVYNASDLNTRLQRIEQATGTVTVNLNNNTNYVCLFWADDVARAGDDTDNTTNTTGTFNALDLKNVTLNSGKEMEEAFFAKQTISGSIPSHNITLKRPIAQISFVATDVVTAQTPLQVTFDQYPGFNTMTSDVVGTPVSTDKTFTSAATTGTLGSLFTFASTVGITRNFTAVYNSLVSNTLSNTPLKANFRTNLIGAYSVGLQDFTAIIVVDDYWANTMDWVEINLGTAGTPSWLRVADRNAEKGSPYGATAGATTTDYGYHYQWSNATNNSPNNVDRAYKACFDFGEGSGAWRLPTEAEWIAILGGAANHSINGNRKLQFDSGAWKLSDERTGLTTNSVIFPMGGNANTPGSAAGSSGIGVSAYYWSSTPGGSGPWVATFDDSAESSIFETGDTSLAISVRCVRTGTGTI